MNQITQPTPTQKINVLEALLLDLKAEVSLGRNTTDNMKRNEKYFNTVNLKERSTERLLSYLTFGEQWLQLKECQMTGNKLRLTFLLVGTTAEVTIIKSIEMTRYAYIAHNQTENLWGKTYNTERKLVNQFNRHKGFYFFVHVAPNDNQNYPYLIGDLLWCRKTLIKEPS